MKILSSDLTIINSSGSCALIVLIIGKIIFIKGYNLIKKTINVLLQMLVIVELFYQHKMVKLLCHYQEIINQQIKKKLYEFINRVGKYIKTELLIKLDN